MLETNKSLKTKLNEIEISDLLNREFKIIVIKMLTRSGEQFMNKVRITER